MELLLRVVLEDVTAVELLGRQVAQLGHEVRDAALRLRLRQMARKVKIAQARRDLVPVRRLRRGEFHRRADERLQLLIQVKRGLAEHLIFLGKRWEVPRMLAKVTFHTGQAGSEARHRTSLQQMLQDRRFDSTIHLFTPRYSRLFQEKLSPTTTY